ncbi:putative U-box domain-containing protein 34-like [Capsicum annuum]|nr:putative U-box domain-containing protein 34-like [Capsicum annuum]
MAIPLIALRFCAERSNKDVKAPNVFERVKEEFDALLHSERRSDQHHKETHGLRKDIDENTPIDDVKAPNVFERAKEEIEALVQAIHPKKEDHIHASTSDDDNRTDGTMAELKHNPGNKVKVCNFSFISIRRKNKISFGSQYSEHYKIYVHRMEMGERSSDGELSFDFLDNHGVWASLHASWPISRGNTIAITTAELFYSLWLNRWNGEESITKAPTNQDKTAKEATESHSPGQKSPHRHHKETHGRSDDIDANTPINEVKGPNIFERAKEEIQALFHSIHRKK